MTEKCNEVVGSKRVCYATYHLITDVFPKLKGISKHDENIIKGMLPGGKYHDMLWPMIAQIEYTYLKDEVGHMENIGECSDLGYVDHLYGKGAWWYSSYRFHITYERGDWYRIWNMVCPNPHIPKKEAKKEFMEWYKRLVEHMLWAAVAGVVTDIGELVAIAVMIAAIDGFKEWLESLGLPAWLLNPIFNLLGLGKNALTNQENDIMNNLKEIGNAIAGNNQLLKWLVNNGIQELQTGLKNIETTVSNVVSQTLDKITPLVDNIKNWITNAYNKTIDTINHTIDTAMQHLTGQTQAQLNDINARLDQFIGQNVEINLSRLLP